MIQYKRSTFWALLSLMMVSCGHVSHDTRIEEIDKNDNFAITASPEDISFSPTSIINIEDWTFDGETVLCRSSNTGNIFYRLGIKNFETIDSFGTEGQGPDEYITPRIVKSNRGNIVLADISKNIFTANGMMPDTLRYHNYYLNSPVDIKYPVIGFTGLRGEDRLCYYINIKTGEIVDSISFIKKDPGTPEASQEFKVASNGSHTVIVKQFLDEMLIASHDENGHITNIRRFSGTGESGMNKPCYIDVECGDKYIYILSMKDMNFDDRKEPSGYSTIEIRDYEANPVKQIRLSYYPRKILLDDKNNRLLALSALDEDIHVINL